jgi:type I restriction enzyme S subunit
VSWKTVALGEYYKVASSKRVLKSEWQTEGVPFYRGREITALSKQGYVENELYITKEMYEKYAKIYGVPSASDIMITAIGTIGNTYIVKDTDKFYFKDASVLWLSKEKEINERFVNYWFKSSLFYEQLSVGLGATVDTLTISKVQSLLIKLPSLATQQKIVTKLDAIFAEIDTATAAAEANDKNAEALFQSYLTEVFERGGEGWERKTIEEITDKTKNVSPDKSPDIEFTYVDVSSISNTSYSIISTQKLLGKDAPSRAKKNIITNDILFATVRPTLKRIAIVPEFLENQVASTGYVVLRTNKKNYHKFLFYFLFTSTFNEAMESLQRGASYPAVTDSDVKLQKLLVPSYEEQYKISEKLEQINSSISIKINSELRKIEELKALKQAILQKAFSGELVKD